MSAHIETGKSGESMALSWLRERGFTILHHNWRWSYYELDIIATKVHPHRHGPKTFLHFIEVKTRYSERYGFPEESVGKKKVRNVKRAADAYLQKHPGHRWIRFDILSIVLKGKSEASYFLLEDIG